MLLRNRLQFTSIFLSPSSSAPLKPQPFTLTFRTPLSNTTNPKPTGHVSAASKTTPILEKDRSVLFLPPGVDPDEVTQDMVLPGSNIVIGPYAGDAKIKEVVFVKSSSRAKDCPKHDRPEFAILGRSNVGKSSLINALVRKKDVALTSKKPGLVSSPTKNLLSFSSLCKFNVFGFVGVAYFV